MKTPVRQPEAGMDGCMNAQGPATGFIVGLAAGRAMEHRETQRWRQAPKIFSAASP